MVSEPAAKIVLALATTFGIGSCYFRNMISEYSGSVTQGAYAGLMKLEQGLNEVWAFRGNEPPAVNFDLCSLAMRFNVASDEPEQETHERSEPEADHGLDERDLLRARVERFDPRVVARILQHPKRFSKAQIPNDVERCPVVPGSQIQWPSFERAGCRVDACAPLLDSLHQKIHVAAHETLLGPHGAIAEAEGKVASYQGVIFFCLAQDIVRCAALLQVEVLGLGMFDLTALVRVDIGPGLRINEGYFVRC